MAIAPTRFQRPVVKGPAGRTPYVGRPMLRAEDRLLLLGRGAFLDDIDRPGQLYARVVRSHIAHGRIRSIDVERARRRADVVAVVTAADLPETLRIPIRLVPSPTAQLALQPPLAAEFVRYVGEPLAVVVATSAYAAEDAAEEVWAEIDALPAVVDPVAGATQDAPVVHEAVSRNVVDVVSATTGGDLDGLFEAADIVVREWLGVHRHTAIPLEPRGLVAEPQDDGSLIVWGPTKVKHHNRRVLAEMLDIPVERVRFVEPDVGGGFGVRGEFYPEDFLVPWLALLTGRPVKWVEDRQEHFVATNHSREQRCLIEVAATAAGELLALRAKVWVDVGAYVRTNGLVLPLNTVTHLAGPYRWRAFAAEALGVLTNKTPAATYRGPGQYEAALHRERMIDLVARRVRIDPAALRRRNLVPSEAMPYTLDLAGLAEPVVYDGGDFPRLWDAMCDHVSYDRLREEITAERRMGRHVGIGTAAYVEVEARGPFEWARIVPDADRGFTVYVGVASVGQGIATALTQIAADALGVALSAVTVTYADTDLVPEGGGAFSSRSVIFGGNAVAGAARDLLERSRVAGAQALGVAPDRVELAEGAVIRERDRPDRAIAVADCGCEGSFRYEKQGRAFSMGGALAVVDLDPDTGGASVRRCIVACDIGVSVNPLLVEGQIVGAAAQGIAGVLFESLAYDANGQPLVTSFMDYAMPTATELPAIEALVVELPAEESGFSNPLGVRGAGEVGIIGIGAAVANAVVDAVDGDGVIADLPITPERVAALLRERGIAPWACAGL